jgi:hypothetical protein
MKLLEVGLSAKAGVGSLPKQFDGTYRDQIYHGKSRERSNIPAPDSLARLVARRGSEGLRCDPDSVTTIAHRGLSHWESSPRTRTHEPLLPNLETSFSPLTRRTCWRGHAQPVSQAKSVPCLERLESNGLKGRDDSDGGARNHLCCSALT